MLRWQRGYPGVWGFRPLVCLTKTAPVDNEMILDHIAEHVPDLPRS